MSSRNDEENDISDHDEDDTKKHVDDDSSDSWEDDDDENESNIFYLRSQASGNPDASVAAVEALNNLLLDDPERHVAEVIEVGFVPILVTCLENKGRSKLKMEAARALARIANTEGPGTQAIIEAGAIPKLADILKSDVPVDTSSFEEDFILKNHALEALRVIMADDPSFRDVVLSYQVIPTIIRLALMEKTPQKFVNTSSYALSFLWRDDPPPLSITPEEIFPALKAFLSSEDEETVYDSLCTLSHIAENGAPFIQKILDAGFGPQIMGFLGNKSVREFRSEEGAFFAFGGMVSGTVEQTAALLEGQGGVHFCHHFADFLGSNDPSICEVASWIVSNLAMGENSFIDLVFRAGLIPLIALNLDIGEDEIKKHAALTIANILGCHEVKYTKRLVVDHAIIPLMCKALGGFSEQTTKLVTDGLVEILETFQNKDHHLFKMAHKEIRDNYGLDHCYSLRNHPEPEIQQFAEALIDFY